MVTAEELRLFSLTLPRSEVHYIRDRMKFRVGRIVYVAFSRDEKTMGFGFPKEEREALCASEPDKFFMPGPADLRYQWCCANLDALDLDEATELVVEAWMMCVPKKVRAQYLGTP
jgi:hypothetical protein